MGGRSPGEVTRLLRALTAGREAAADEIFPIVYDELRAIAHSFMARERPGRTLQTTALVHEAYLRLVGGEETGWKERGHFFKAAAEAMRRILVESARAKARLKRGGGAQRVDFDENLGALEPPAEDVLALDEALARLQRQDPGMAGVVKLRYFAGLTVAETANALGLSPSTVNRQWTAARAWLRVDMAS